MKNKLGHVSSVTLGAAFRVPEGLAVTSTDAYKNHQMHSLLFTVRRNISYCDTLVFTDSHKHNRHFSVKYQSLIKWYVSDCKLTTECQILPAI